MNRQDGETISKVLEEYVNIEINAGNRLTKCNGSFILSEIMGRLIKLSMADANKEKLWEECGEKWLIEKNKKEKYNKVIDANKTIGSKLLDEKLKSDINKKNKK